jgi:RNA polymerase sigma-70 factor (ECF subfamily)
LAENSIHIISEEDLVALLRNQDKRAVSVLYDKYSAALFGVILRIIKDEEVAEDVLQEAFVKIWSSFSAYDASKGRLFTWMLNVTKNMAIDKIRSKQYRVGSTMLEIDKGAAQHIPSVGGFRPEHIGLKEVLNHLSEDQRQVIDLMYFEGFTQTEIAEEFNIPLGTVKTRARSAIKQLSRYLKDVE